MTLELILRNLPWEGDFDYEAECILRLFFPGEKIAILHQPQMPQGDWISVELTGQEQGISIDLSVQIGGQTQQARDMVLPSEIVVGGMEWEAERRLCLLLFHALCRLTGIRPPWGILTGVRPVRLCRKLKSELGSVAAVREALIQYYQVLPQKADLALSTLMAQEEILADNTPESYSLYVGIPFCPTRCLYCSFVSHAIDKAGKLVPDYLELLCRELQEIAAIAARLGLRLRTVYIGGGTPTTLEPEQLTKLLGQIEKSFPLSQSAEYTVEAGRPDSITKGKLQVLRDFGVSRISINPQALDDTVLQAIGRAHTAQQTLEAVALAREMGFDNINMDLIAGLPEQTPQSFSRSLEQVLALGAENITVHTLTVKRSSDLRATLGSDAYDSGSYPLAQLLAQTQEKLREAGYLPYYLYRQQGTRQNQENTGFCLPGREGFYNIYSMEDAHTILAAGAGGVTKLCAAPDKMRRVFNYKYPYEYISGFEEILKRKRQITEFYKEGSP